MKTNVTVLGTRGIPDVQGGVETHCQNLYPEIYRLGNAEICVLARSPYVNYRRSEYKGVKLKSLCWGNALCLLITARIMTGRNGVKSVKGCCGWAKNGR